MERRSLIISALLSATAICVGAAGAAAAPCLIKGNFESVCLTATGSLARESSDGYLYVGVDERAGRRAAQYDWGCTSCHRAFRLDPKTYADRLHQPVFRRQAAAIDADTRVSWSGGWSLAQYGGRICVARGRGPALACFPEDAFVFRGTSRRDYMVHSPGPIKPTN